ncbi:MAG: zinc ribbon domain-containing protein [Candidatus Kariarchaeaceae archaeon]
MGNLDEIYQRMSFMEILFAGIGVAWIVFGIIFGLTISGILFVMFTFIAMIFFVLSLAYLQLTENQKRKLISLVIVHKQISVKEASNLLGQSSKTLIKNYVSILETQDKDKIRYDPSAKVFFAVGAQITPPTSTATSQNTSKPSFESIAKSVQVISKVSCAYCGYENKKGATFCASCGASTEK